MCPSGNLFLCSSGLDRRLAYDQGAHDTDRLAHCPG